MVCMSYETCSVIRNIRQSYAELSIVLASVHTERGKNLFIDAECDIAEIKRQIVCEEKFIEGYDTSQEKVCNASHFLSTHVPNY